MSLLRQMLPPHAAPAPIAQPLMYFPQQPAMQQMQYFHQPAATAMDDISPYSYLASWPAMASPIDVAPLAAVAHVPNAPPTPKEPANPARRGRGRARGSATAGHRAAPYAPPPQETAKKARRGRGRPRGSTATSSRPTTASPAYPSPLYQDQPAATGPAIIDWHDDDGVQKQEDDENKMQMIAAVDGGGVAAAGEEEVEYADTSAPGVRFQPSDEELIGYLRRKYLLGHDMPNNIIKMFDVYEEHPDKVQEKCGNSVDGSWYVFSPRKRRYCQGKRPARSVGSVGYWKSNTKETDIVKDGVVVGKVNSVTFQHGHQPNGVPTPCRMKEYRIPDRRLEANGKLKLLDEWVLCRLFRKDGAKQKALVLSVQTQDQSGEDHEEDINKADGEEDNMEENQCLNSFEQDLSVDDYPLSELDVAPAFADHPAEQIDEHNLGGH